LKINGTEEGTLFVISAPSGAGKTTLVNKVLQKLAPKYSLSKVITYTSRNPRTNEVEGIDYFFITKQNFIKKKEEGFFLETTTYNGEFYGSPRSIKATLEKGQSLVLISDWNGAKNLLTINYKPILLWIVPPNLDILKKRLMIRGTETKQEIEKRIHLAKKEMEDEDRERIFDYHIINDDFEKAVNEICSLMIYWLVL
jgi:guanylate kinase